MSKKKENYEQAHEIRITREYDAPVKLVWDAWTDPAQAAKWWGPRGFTITHHSKDLRVGGHWHYTMHGPDGVDYPNTTKYIEVEKHKRMVYDHGGHEDRPPMFRVTVLFEELKGGRTKMDMCMALPTPEAAAESRKFIKKAGGSATWDRLGEYLAEETQKKDLFVINRSFACGIEKMFEVWTNPEHFKSWMGPTGSQMEFIRANIKTGGETFYKMWSPNGPVMYGKAKYLEITPHTRLVYTQVFVTEDEKISRHPLAPTWPESMLTTVVFTPEGADRTRVTLTWEVHGNASAEERATFHSSKAGMGGGWGGSFDKLDELLAK
ncbi:MAG: hypothetical protein RJA70_363 [Pseudomonadota bacterium]|jgi:uncharacterized protein YndB with AHSA1/START domain